MKALASAAVFVAYLLYALAFFVFIAPLAYLVAYIFHHGMMPIVLN